MNAQIAQHFNTTESNILRVEEWAHVLFVVVRSLGARFVSKKVVKKVDRKNCTPCEYAELVAAELNKRNNDAPYKNFKAKTWHKKTGETRVYLGDYGYYGIYHEPDSDGNAQVIYKVKSYMQDFVRNCVSEVRKTHKLVIDNTSTLVSRDPLTARICTWCLVNDAMDGFDQCCDCID